MKSDNHHPECRMPACGIEGKYQPDCSEWQRKPKSVKQGLNQSFCFWCSADLPTPDSRCAMFSEALLWFCGREHEQLYADDNGYKLIDGKYFKPLTNVNCRNCLKVYEVMIPEKVLVQETEEIYYFCTVTCTQDFFTRSGMEQIWGVYQFPPKMIEEPSEETMLKIKDFLDQRCTCRENWESGLHFNNDELPELINEFMHWFAENQ